MDLVNQIIESLNASLEAENLERESNNLARLPLFQIRVLGQMSLLMDEEAVKVLPLVMTADFDAVIVGSQNKSRLRIILKDVLKEFRLDYDDLSTEVWLPPTAEFLTYFENSLIKVERVDTLSALTSKAVKASERNRELIRHALTVFGQKLESQITMYGGDLKLFLPGRRVKL